MRTGTVQAWQENWLCCENWAIHINSGRKNEVCKGKKHSVIQLSKNSTCNFPHKGKWADHASGSGRVLVSRTPQTFFAGCVNMITCSGCPKRNPSHNLHFIPHPRWLIGLLSFVESGATAVGVASIAIVLVRCGKKRRLYSGAAPQNLMWVRPAVCCSGSPCWISPASWPLGASSACYASWSPPRWRRWACPCRLSGSPTGSRSSDWTTPRPGTLCSCSAAAGCRGEIRRKKNRV